MEHGDYMAARILFDNYRSGKFPDETEKNAALCMIFFICQCGLLEFKRDITDEELVSAEEELELDAHVRRLIATHKTEGRELHARIMKGVYAKADAAAEQQERRIAQAREKLPALCRKAENRLREMLSAGAGDAAPAPCETTPQDSGKPRPAGSPRARPSRAARSPDRTNGSAFFPRNASRMGWNAERFKPERFQSLLRRSGADGPLPDRTP